MTADPPARRARWRRAAAGAAVTLLAACGGGSDGGSEGASDGGARPTSTMPVTSGSVATAPPAPFEAFASLSVRVTLPDGSTRDLCLLLADREELRQRGLMEVTDLAGYDGMAFRWGGQEVDTAFYMFRTRLPLSIAYYGDDGGYLGANDMPPCPESDAGACPVYAPPAPFVTAVEVPQGELVALGLVEGSRLTDETLGCSPPA